MFYKETAFQDTLIGKIPKDWEVTKMGNVAHVKGRIGWRGLKASEYTTEGPYLIANKHLVDDRIAWDKCDHLSEFRYNESPEIQLQTDDVIISKDGTIGQPAFIDSLPDRATINSTMMLLRVNNDVLAPEFLFYFLQGLHFRRFLKQKISGTSIPHLFQRDMKELDVLLPSVLEQRGVVGVLGVVDLAVAKTGEVIAKTERLKKGLMQELLTKGIGHKEWNVVQLEDLISDVKNGFASGKRDEKGIVQVRMNNITTDGRLVLDSYLKVPTPENIDVWLLRPNDFLFNNTNSIDLVGKSAIFKGASFPCTFSNHFTRIRFKENLVLPEWILYHFITHWQKGYFKSVAIRHVGQAAVHTEYLLRLKISLPPLDEQKKIVEILSTTNRKLELERNEKTKLEKIKRVLMDLLLTGKVRVKGD
jgi:type I restriction enzyme S subunit